MEHMATKADLEAMGNKLKLWMIGAIATSTVTLVVAAVMFMARVFGLSSN